MSHACLTSLAIAQPPLGPRLCPELQRPDRLVELSTPPELDRWIGCRADSLTEVETAAALATRAWQQSSQVAGNSPHVGIGCRVVVTETLLRCTVVVHTRFRTELLQWEGPATDDAGFVRKGSRILERLLQEANPVETFDLARVGDPAGGVRHEVAEAPESIRRLISGEVGVVWRHPHGEMTPEHPQNVRAVLSGAFNPLHAGHMALRQAASEFLGRETAYELPIVNADKPPLDFLALEARTGQFRDGPVALSGAATFAEKARLLPRTTFVVGYDTAIRILEPRYYGGTDAMRAALQQFGDSGGSFLVAGRLCEGTFRSLTDLPCPTELRDLFEELPASRFRVDLSSTELRRSR